MAEQFDPGILPRTYFRAPRVPFDFRALALAILGFLVYWSGGLLLSEIFWPSNLPDGASYDVPGAFLLWAFELFRGIPYIGGSIAELLTGALRMDPGMNLDAYGFWEILVGGVWFIGVWSFFALGIHRITTLRIARDEGLSIGEALAFSAKNWVTLLLAPIIVGGVIGLFYACNMLAGLAISIPGLGGILALILVPLAFISTLLILLVGLGGVFGLPLIGAAAAWECNGSLDAISRAFSYLFARPLQFFWNFFLIFLFTGIILLVGSWFTFTFAKSIDSGVVSTQQTLLIDPPPKVLQEGSDYGDYDEQTKALYKDLGIDGRDRRAPLLVPPAMDIKAVGAVDWTYKLNALVFWLFFNFIWLGVSGYALYWLIGASSSVYADLRADVDGTEEDEVYIEEEDQDLDVVAEGGPAEEAAAVADDTPPADEPAKADEPADAPAAEGESTPEAESTDDAEPEDKPETE
ncbi:MAG: hypothetical protein QNJ90_14570 [Planctomycetota bacterium]|nr:hypothetical protein [Planctomycetota bacterium]